MLKANHLRHCRKSSPTKPGVRQPEASYREPNAGTPRLQRYDPVAVTGTSFVTVSRKCVLAGRCRHAAVTVSL